MQTEQQTSNTSENDLQDTTSLNLVNYQALFEEAPVAYLVTDAQGVVREANHAATRLLNMIPEFLIGKPLAVLVVESDRADFRYRLLQLKPSDGTQQWEARLHPRKRPPIEVQLIVTVAENSQGQYLRWIIQDITAFAQIQVAEREQLFHASFDHAPVGMAHLGFSGFWLRANQRFCQLTGYSQSELQNLPYHALTHPEDSHLMPETNREQRYGSIPAKPTEKRYIRKDGRVIWVSMTISSVRTPNSHFMYNIVTIEDITERKYIQVALDKSHKLIVDTLESIQDAFYSVNAEWRFIYINQEAERLFGLSRTRLLGKPIWKKFPQLVDTPEHAKHIQAYESRQTEVIETFSSLFGTWLEYRIFPNQDGGLSVYLHDITIRKAEQRRQQFLIELQPLILEAADTTAWFEKVTAFIGSFFEVSRCAYVELEPSDQFVIVYQDYAADLPTLQGVYEIESFHGEVSAKLKNGQTAVISDTTQDGGLIIGEGVFEDFEIRSCVVVPLIQAGELVAFFLVAHHEMRKWQPGEVELLEEAALRASMALDRSRADAARIKTIEQLEREQAQLQAIFQSMPDGIYVGDENSIWQFNQALVQMYGLEDDATFQKSLTNVHQAIQPLIPGTHEVRPLEKSAFVQALKGQLAITETSVRHSNGREIIIRTAAAPIKVQGKVVGAVAIATDITERIRMATIEERHRLSRDLHDAVMQSLFAASIIAQSLPRMWDKNRDEVPRQLLSLEKLSQSALSEMRILLVELRPEYLLRMSLTDGLRHLANALKGRKQVEVELKIEGSRKAPPDVQVALYRIAQEAINNIVKHSQATQVNILLRMLPEKIELHIEDNGRGFDPKARGSGFGQDTMCERANGINAEYHLESQPGMGTKTHITWWDGKGETE
jgi:PAS domain S-box-containing protein